MVPDGAVAAAAGVDSLPDCRRMRFRNETAHAAWLTVDRGDGPLLVSMPHTGTDIPPAIEADARLALARPQGCRLVDRPAL